MSYYYHMQLDVGNRIMILRGNFNLFNVCLMYRCHIRIAKTINCLVLTIIYFGSRQCMCCYRDSKNFERLNNIVQVAMNLAITLIQTVPDDEKERTRTKKDNTDSKESGAKEKEEKTERQTKNEAKNDGATGSNTKQDDVEKDAEKNDAQAKGENSITSGDENVTKPNEVDKSQHGEETTSEEKSAEKDDGKKGSADKDSEGEKAQVEEEAKKEEDAEEATWTMDEKDQLFQFITKVSTTFSCI